MSLVWLAFVTACGPASSGMSTEGGGGSSTGTSAGVPTTSAGSGGEPVDAIAWTYTHDGAANKRDMALGVAVDKAGRIIVVGVETGETQDGLIIALSSEGEELWRRTFDGLAGLEDEFWGVVLDDDGRIFVAGSEEVAPNKRTSIVRAFDVEGGELWRFAEEPAVPSYAYIAGLALADGALYSVGADRIMDGGGLFTVRRHDPDTGALAWRTATQAGWKGAYGSGITATAERVIAVGYVKDEDIQPLTVVLDPAGAIVSETLQAIPRGFWNQIAPIGAAGDLMLVGGTFMPGVINRDVIVRRVDANFVEQWSRTHEHEMLEDMGLGVAVGANEGVFIGGAVTSTGTAGEHKDIFGARYTGEGTLLWTDLHDHPVAHGDDYGQAAAAGPGFFVLAGYETTPDHNADVWVRRFNDD